MNVLDACKVLGLQPPLEFLWSVPERETRQLGATTHMLVTAATEVAQGKDVLIVGRNLEHAEKLGLECARMANRLLMGDIIRKTKRAYHLGSVFGTIYYESTRTRVRFLAGRRGSIKEFQDHIWHQEALRARQGPYQAIREIRKENGRYIGYAASGERLDVELSEEGVQQMLEQEPFRVKLVG